MDWERTKTIFILAFLMLNLVFSIQLWIIPNYFDSSMIVSHQQVEAKLTELRYRNITVTAEVPRQLKRMRMLLLSSPEVDHKKAAMALLGPDAVHVATILSPAPGHRRYVSKQGEVQVYNDGRILFISSPHLGKPALSASSARSIADNFLKNSLGKPGDARFGRVVEAEDGAWLIEYYQNWRRRDLETSKITLLVDGSGVRQMDYYWVKVTGFTGEEVVSIPAAGALIVAAERMPSGTVITNIYSSWYSPPIMADIWRAPPVWVVETNRGTKYYINAFTGDLEGKEEFPAGKPEQTLN
jgi:hypothetical protein